MGGSTVHLPHAETLIKFFSQGGSKCSQNGDRCERAEGVMAQDQPVRAKSGTLEVPEFWLSSMYCNQILWKR